MSLDGKLGVLIVTLAALFLIYLDNSGKLYPAMGLIAGPAIDDGAAQVAAASVPAAAPANAAPMNLGGLSPLPVTAGSIQPLPAGSSGFGTIKGINGAIPGAGSAVTGITAPYAPALPVIVSGRR